MEVRVVRESVAVFCLNGTNLPSMLHSPGKQGGARGIQSGVEGTSLPACRFSSEPGPVCVAHMVRVNYWKLEKWLEGESLPVPFISVP